jgi:hypothetical protein
MTHCKYVGFQTDATLVDALTYFAFDGPRFWIPVGSACSENLDPQTPQPIESTSPEISGLVFPKAEP